MFFRCRISYFVGCVGNCDALEVVGMLAESQCRSGGGVEMLLKIPGERAQLLPLQRLKKKRCNICELCSAESQVAVLHG